MNTNARWDAYEDDEHLLHPKMGDLSSKNFSSRCMGFAYEYWLDVPGVIGCNCQKESGFYYNDTLTVTQDTIRMNIEGVTTVNSLT